MDIKTVKSIVGMFEGSKLDKLEVEECDGEKRFSVRMEKGGTIVAAAGSASAAPSGPVPKGNAPIEYSEGVVDFNRVADVKSPMVGVFYASATPDGEPFVNKGSKIRQGDTLCIIEAMKLMNEIVAERDGEIVEVAAKNGELVEFGQVLFRIY